MPFADVPNPDRARALRIIDANFNRATEGLRVVEDYCRFALGDRHLTERCKQVRHDLTGALELSRQQLHAARDTQADVGTSVTTPAEQSRCSLAHIAAANWQRVLQALRAIEEYSKLISPDVARRIEALRYQAYTLAKACTTTADSQERLAHARLYVLLDGRSSECEFVLRAQELIAAGVHVLQLRDKRLDDRALLARARLLRRAIDESAVGNALRGVPGADSRPPTSDPRPPIPDPRLPTSDLRPPTSDPRLLNPEPRTLNPLLIVNDRPDIAVLSRADGVHLGQDELTVHDARQIVGPDMLVGVSTHNLDQARQAVLDGASYLGCGPTFPSGTKEFDDFPGLDFLRQVAAEIALPAFAIGGITRENLPQVLATGFTRVAIGGAIATNQEPTSAVRHFLTELSPRA
jgi:thiamine-phosphate pyrophosphorylase